MTDQDPTLGDTATSSVIPVKTGIQSDAPALEGPALGDTTFDIHLNDRAYRRNVPAAVWLDRLGGYQVLKKWLSYRERTILNRPIHPEEVQHFTHTARRIGAILVMPSVVGA